MAQEVNPLNLPDHYQGIHLPEGAAILLRFFPSGTCLNLPINTWVVLGRSFQPGQDNAIDLGRFEAHEHGVSRQHCLLRRRDTRLTVTDMNSTNGTFINGDQLEPGKEYVLASGDHLTLGMLLVGVFFDVGNSSKRH